MKKLIVVASSILSLNSWSCLNFSGFYKDGNLPEGHNTYQITQPSCQAISFDYGEGEKIDYIADGKYRVTKTSDVYDRGNVVGKAILSQQVGIVEKGLIINEVTKYEYMNGSEEIFKSGTQYSILPNGDLLLAITSDGDTRFEVNRKLK